MEGTINFKDYWRYNSSINLARLSVCEDPCCLQRSPEQVGGPGISSSGRWRTHWRSPGGAGSQYELSGGRDYQTPGEAVLLLLRLRELEAEEEEEEEEVEEYPGNHPVQHSRQYDWSQNAANRESYEDDSLLHILLPCDQDS